MKNSIIISLLLSGLVKSQVVLGGDAGTAADKTSVLLDFAASQNKGIVVPYVETLPADNSAQSKPGTIIFDVSGNTEYKVKVKNTNNTSPSWTDLSGQSGYSSAVENIVKTAQASLTDVSSAKVIIGANASAADGILILESSNKAMVLPIVSDYTAIKNPAPGMIAFLKPGTDPSRYRLIIFNGQKWSFWAPSS
ncbi:hypothetical protein [Chryseobacterium indologenes]|uniref:Uncharacterized protein n=1 Tax=Chryseobacterium indologenes TaxID=253 RepID=A0A0N0ZV03_CHRID|nr:hypothetical protein [Chryseobacterium indologenes]KPE51588.1 hypothetical protein AOB46_07975 [Chryseobacterium indologenes]